jgi:hypothetical protein
MTSIVTDLLCGFFPITADPASPSISFMRSSDLELGWVVEREGNATSSRANPS